MFSFKTLALVCLVTVVAGWPGWHVPEQIHIAAGETPDQMIIVWTTMNDTDTSTVLYGKGGNTDQTMTGKSVKFQDAGSEKRFWWIHSVVLGDLTADTTYTYKVGCSMKYSDTFTFHTWPLENWSPNLLVFGDLGYSNAQSMPALQQEVNSGKYDAIIHVGDLAYNMNSDNSRVGDKFMNMIQPIAATLPYMTCPGNHESEGGSFANYKQRFYMPGDDAKNMWFSFNMGNIHFLSVSTEAYFGSNWEETAAAQYKWMEKDLQEATSEENRAKRPWIIVFGHRPFYCSNSDGDDCTKPDGRVRNGADNAANPGLEKLLNKYGVDIGIWAHEHSYERFWPVFENKVYNGSTTAPYTNPGAPVHIVTGTAGCSEHHDPYPNKVDNPLSAFHSQDYGYMKLKAYNSSHLYMEEMSIDKNDVLDSVWVIKDKHGPYYNQYQ